MTTTTTSPLPGKPCDHCHHRLVPTTEPTCADCIRRQAAREKRR